jgi:hypothetical protein
MYQWLDGEPGAAATCLGSYLHDVTDLIRDCSTVSYDSHCKFLLLNPFHPDPEGTWKKVNFS